MAGALALATASCRPPSGVEGELDGADRDSGAQPAIVPADEPCEPGSIRCNANQPAVCGERGDAWVGQPSCEGATPACVEGRGCAACQPGARDCDGATPRQCAADGATWQPGPACDAASGQTCRFGACVDACAEAEASRSYVGCEYWAVDLPNCQQRSGLAPRDAEFAVVVSNANETPATVRVFSGGNESEPLLTATAPPDDLVVLALNEARPPGQTNVDGSGIHEGRAFRIVSDLPVTAYQFNPLNNTEAAFSNDASLLLPATSLDRDYIVVSGDGLVGADASARDVTYDWGAFIAVVAVEDGTAVSVAPTARISGGPSVPAGAGPVEVTLDRFDVLNLESVPSRAEQQVRGDANLSGSRVSASAPVAVFAGNVAAVVPHGPDGRCCADHLEEQMIPLTAWGRSFVVGRGMSRRVADDPEAEFYRITGGNVPPGQSVIHLAYPAFVPEGAPSELAEGQSVEFASTVDFVVEADGPIMVASFFASSFFTAPELDAVSGRGMRACMTDSDCGGLPYAAVCYQGSLLGSCAPIGDPSMTIVPPVEQFRDSYVFLAPLDYAHDAITVVAPLGSSVLLDGAPLAGLVEIGAVGGVPYGVQRVEVSDGTHRLSAEGGATAGLLVYGMDKDVSYGYPGGLDLEVINPIE
jgi:hypothetical protein